MESVPPLVDNRPAHAEDCASHRVCPYAGRYVLDAPARFLPAGPDDRQPMPRPGDHCVYADRPAAVAPRATAPGGAVQGEIRSTWRTDHRPGDHRFADRLPTNQMHPAAGLRPLSTAAP